MSDMTNQPRKYAVMADENSRLNVYATKAEAKRYLAECQAYARSQGRTFGGFIAEWSEERGQYVQKCTNCRCTVRPLTWHNPERKGLCREMAA